MVFYCNIKGGINLNPFNKQWINRDEINFINNLGRRFYTERNDLKTFPLSRIAYLERYRDALKNRSRWGALDRDTIESYIHLSIMDELET